MALKLKSAKLDLYIYTGSQENKGDPKYTLTKTRITSEPTIVFEISELVRDYIDISFTGNYDKIIQTAWVQTELTRTFEDDQDNTITSTDGSPLTRRYIAFRGYGELFDTNAETNLNTNPTLSTNFLISNNVIYHLKGEQLYVPFYVAENGVFQVDYKKNNAVVSTFKYGGSVKFIRTDNTTLRTDNAGDIYDTTTTAVRGDDSNGFTSKDVVVLDSVDEIVVTKKDGTSFSREIREIEECKYDPLKVSFLNKFGVIQDLWFFKRSDRGMNVERDEHRKTTIQHLATGTNFNTYDNPTMLLSSRAKKTLTMNTGFVSEDHNEVIKQLLNTEFCWVHQPNQFGFTEPTPAKPTSLSFTEQQEVNEKLLNFTLGFELSHNFIQDIR